MYCQEQKQRRQHYRRSGAEAIVKSNRRSGAEAGAVELQQLSRAEVAKTTLSSERSRSNRQE